MGVYMQRYKILFNSNSQSFKWLQQPKCEGGMWLLLDTNSKSCSSTALLDFTLSNIQRSSSKSLIFQAPTFHKAVDMVESEDIFSLEH